MDATYVIPVKGRLGQLQETLPCRLNQETTYSFDIVVVDYGCPDGTADWVEDQDDPRLKVIRVPAPDNYFNLSHARNCGCRVAEGEILFVSDADSMQQHDYLHRMVRRLYKHPKIAAIQHPWASNQRKQQPWTTNAIRKSSWEAVRGYDEDLEGWGFEEVDFRRRIEKFVGKVESINPQLVWCLTHAAELRSQFYEQKDTSKTNRTNKQKARDPGRKINPHGFGLLTRNKDKFK